MKKIFTLIMTLLLICSSSWAGTFTIRVNKDAACTMDLSNGLYLWWWSDVDGNEFVSTTLQDGWYTATIISDANTISCLAANYNDWSSRPAQTADYIGITSDICFSLTESSSYLLQETSCESASGPISVTDGSLSDWDNLPQEYVYSCVCPTGAAYDGLLSMKAYADEKYINLAVEYNPEVITDLAWVPFHIYIDTDNSALTGGFGDQWTSAAFDVMLETSVLAEGYSYPYNPGVFWWWGEVGTTGWIWSDPLNVPSAENCWGSIVCEGSVPLGNSQLVGNTFEIQLDREFIPTRLEAPFGDVFNIGVDIQQGWVAVGVLPTAPDDVDGIVKAAPLTVRVAGTSSENEDVTPASNYHDFEDANTNAQWHFVQDGQTNYWVIGSGAGSASEGNNALYITNNGYTYGYDKNTSSISWAYIPVVLSETDQISFDWKCAGESGYDYLSVYLLPEGSSPLSGSQTVPDDAINLVDKYCEVSQWQQFESHPNVTGAYNLCFMWINDGSVGNSTPIAIDNVFYGTPGEDEDTTVPTADDLAQYEQDGYFVACINFQGEVCNDIVFAGSYNSWNTNPEEMVHFTPLNGFDGWYVAVVPVSYDEDGVEANEGKPIQLASDGTFSWDYQTGDFDSWELISGSVDIMSGYSGESNLRNWSSAEPVILKSLYFKNNNSPCGDIVTYDYTINLKAPDCGGYEPAIIGDFNNWVEGVAMAPMGDGWYQAIVNSMPGRRVNFRASTSADWSNAIQIYDSEYGAWLNIADYYLTEETTINLDYSAGKYTLCENDVPTPECYTLNVNVAEGGYVNISPEADCYEEGTQITLTAEAYEGYQFSQWSDGNTDNPRLLTMIEDIYLTAEFTYTPIEEYSYTIRVKKDDVSDMDISNGLYLYWWKTDEAGQVATMTLDGDGWYTTTITTTATSINCLAVNVNVDNEGWIGQQTTDYTNITSDICLAIGASDGLYYNLHIVPCEDIEYTLKHDFEDANTNAQWHFVQDGQTNYWVIGSGAGSVDGGSNALYITSDGYNYAYDNTATSVSWAYLPVTLSYTDYITFSWKGYGESCCDYLKVYLLPKGYTPQAGNTELPEVAIDMSETLNGTYEWQHFAAMAGVEGEYNLCLMWRNDYSQGETPIAIDNVFYGNPDEPSAQVKGDRIWPIILDDITASSNASKIVADFRVDDIYNFLYLWDVGAYVAGDVTGLNFHGNTEGYLALTVTAQNGWSGLGFYMGDESSAAAAEQLRQRIIANPDNYYLHFAMKATTQGNHQFYTFNTNATSFAVGAATIDAGQVIGDFPRDGEWYEFDVPMADFADALATSPFPMGGNIFCALSGATVGSQLNLDALYFYEIEGEEEEEETEYSYTIRVKKDNVSDMDISNGLYLYWWKTDEAGQVATMTLDSDGWYTTTITTTATSINCLAVNVNVDNEGWIGQQTTDYTNITGDICLAIGANDAFYHSNYNLYAVPCEDMEYTLKHDFEDANTNAQWHFVQDGQTNYWTIGSAAGSADGGSNALYITSDGYNYAYETDDATSTSWAYLPVNLNITDSITFSWKGYGESYCDYLRVYLLPKGYTPQAGNNSLPEVAIALSDNLNMANNWQHFAAMAGVEGEYNLCLMWQNDNSVGQTPIAVDNVAITTTPTASNYPLTYVLNSDGTATVVKCDAAYEGELSIPSTITHNSRSYTVTAIGDNAFSQCNNITAVSIPNSVTSIGTYAFAYCYSLTSVTLPENLTAIEDYTFYDCWNLAAISIPNNVQSIGAGAFAYCPSLTSIVVESGNTVYDSRDNCNAIVHTESNTLIVGCQSTIIPNTIETIGNEAFLACDNLTSITIPNSVTCIGDYAFANCNNLSSVDIGDGVTTIEYSAFEYCYALTSVTIPASVTSIGSWAFYNCSNIVMEGTTPPQIYSSTFNSDASIWVPCTAVETYQTADYWQDLNIQGRSYAVILSATEGGSAQITNSDCANNTVTIEAYPYERYTFTQWSDGNTDNPRTLTLTEDIALTAEFSLITYPVTNLVVTTNCGKAYASWESEAPYYEVAAFNSIGEYVLFGIVDVKEGVSNSQPFSDGEYIWQVTPMYSSSDGDYAGEAVQVPFTISADNCVDLGIYNLDYTINGETVNITWESEAPQYRIWMYDYNYNVLEEKWLDTPNYSITLSEMGKYHFGIRGYNADATQYSDYSELDIDFVNGEIPYNLNFVYAEQGDNGLWNNAYQRPIMLYSEDYQTIMRIYPMPAYENSIVGTYFVENNDANLYVGGLYGLGSYITYRGLTIAEYMQNGMVTIARNADGQFVVSFDLTDANGNVYTNTCTIVNMYGDNIGDDYVTALSATKALELTQSLEHTNLTTMPYFVEGKISTMHNTPMQIVHYGTAIFDISEDGYENNQFKCYQAKWLNNTNFTTGEEIALGDSVVVYGNLQNYRGNTPEIQGYIYQHYPNELEETCYTLDVLTNNDNYGYVDVLPYQECYLEGEAVTLTAVPYAGCEFVEWSDGVTDAVRILYMYNDVQLTAIFRDINNPDVECYTLTLYPEQLSDGQGGYAYAAPNFDCYEPNTSVVIRAHAAPGYVFSHWSDGDTNAERTIIMTQNLEYTAYFEQELGCYQLNVTSTDGGHVDVTPATQGCYEEGTIVTLAAVADEGFEFVQWNDGNKDATRVVVMNSDCNFHATFTRTATKYDIQNLAVTSSNLKITAKWSSLATRFEITIINNKNEVVKSEKVDISEDNKVYRYTAPKYTTYTITVKPLDAADNQIGIEAFKSITLERKYSLNIYTEYGGTVNEEVNGEYTAGTSVEIIATPNNGYHFSEWSDGDKNAKRTLIMDQDYDLMATFKRIPTYTLEVFEGENGLANIPAGSYTYQENEVVQLTPIPNDGYLFDHWVVNGVNDTNETITLTMTQNYSVYPVCVAIPIPTYTLTILPGEFGKANMAVGTYTYNEGEKVTLLPVADADYLFDQWVVNGEAMTDSVLVLDMVKDYEVMPTFIPNQVAVENIFDGITIRVEHRTIMIEATQTQDFVLYDLVGHMINQCPHTRVATFTVPSAGLYLVRTASGVKKIHVE